MYGLLTSLGVQDAICKVYGNTNPFSVTQAAMKALSKSMSVEEQALRTGRRYFDLNAIYKRTKAMQDWAVCCDTVLWRCNTVALLWGSRTRSYPSSPLSHYLDNQDRASLEHQHNADN